MKRKTLIDRIQENLSQDLLKPEYKNHPNRFYGHCYVASEALWHLTEKRLKPMWAKDDIGNTHWWLENEHGMIFDVTSRQYTDLNKKPPYDRGVRGNFLTQKPSKRCQVLLERVRESS